MARSDDTRRKYHWIWVWYVPLNLHTRTRSKQRPRFSSAGQDTIIEFVRRKSISEILCGGSVYTLNHRRHHVRIPR